MLMNEGVEIRLPEQPPFWHCLISEYLAEQQESFPFTTEWVSWTSLESTLPTYSAESEDTDKHLTSTTSAEMGRIIPVSGLRLSIGQNNTCKFCLNLHPGKLFPKIKHISTLLCPSMISLTRSQLNLQQLKEILFKLRMESNAILKMKQGKRSQFQIPT